MNAIATNSASTTEAMNEMASQGLADIAALVRAANIMLDDHPAKSVIEAIQTRAEVLANDLDCAAEGLMGF